MAWLALLLPALALSYDPDHDYDPDWDGCTSIIVGRQATVDGSALTSHANDCQDCDWRMAYVKARDYPEGAMRKVYDGKAGQYPRLVDPDRSPLLQPGAGVNSTNVTGAIPQARHTFALWESSYSLINEKGLAFGESTCSGHLIGKSVLDGGDAIFAIRGLMSVAMERCETARCAVQTMGDLGAKYGFFGEDPGKGGAGESVQIVDASGEAWVFHIVGGVPAKDGISNGKWAGQRGALWGAARVPDDHVAVVANNFIIREVNPQDTANFMLHPGLFELAQEAGLWDGTGAFDFQKIMAPDIQFSSYNPLLPPIPMYTTLRQWGVFRTIAPSLGLEITTDASAYPFSVPVDKKLTILEVMDLFRTHYEGTQFDMRLGALAGPFQSPNRIEGGRGMLSFPGQFARSPSIGRTSYTQVAQTGPGSEAAVWFAPDASSSSVFVPFYARVLGDQGGGQFDVAAYGQGSMKEFSFTEGTLPAWWAFDLVANWMELNYKNMSETYVYPKVQELQREVAARATEAVAAAAKSPNGAALLAREQTRLQRHVTDEWWKFAAMLIVRYNDAFFNFADAAQQKVVPIGYPAFWLEMIGYDRESFYPTWFSRVPVIPTLLDAADHVTAELAATYSGTGAGLLGSTTALVAAATTGVAIVFTTGLVLGLRLGRHSATISAAPSNVPYSKLDC